MTRLERLNALSDVSGIFKYSILIQYPTIVYSAARYCLPYRETERYSFNPRSHDRLNLIWISRKVRVLNIRTLVTVVTSYILF